MRTKQLIERRFEPLILALAAPGRPFAAFIAEAERPRESRTSANCLVAGIGRTRHRHDRYGRGLMPDLRNDYGFSI